jgi:hypothetical protein
MQTEQLMDWPQIACTAQIALRQFNRSDRGGGQDALREQAEGSISKLPMSMGIANVISGILGELNVTAAGLTAHCNLVQPAIGLDYRIDTDRISASVCRLCTLHHLSFPQRILGFALHVGIQHALFIGDLTDKAGMFIALTVAVCGFVTII